MAKEALRNIRLGIFVFTSTALLIVSLYLIGSKQNLFGSRFRIIAEFHNVNGLMEGNNVRFSGIDVGTVEKVEIISDSSVKVVMIIEERVRKFIRKNSVASVGTDGLMGNRLVNINSVKDHSPAVEENDTIQALRPIETDEMVRTLNTTNENIKTISGDLKKITQKITSSSSLWSLLTDEGVAENVKQAVVNLKLTSNRSAIITGDLSEIVQEVKSGKGSVGALLTDTSFADELTQTIVGIKLVSDQMAVISGDLQHISEKIKRGEGAVGTLLMDTSFVHNLNQSMENIRTGSQSFNENMEALKYSWPFKKYYKQKQKEGKK